MNTTAKRQRLDMALVERRLAPTRARARDAILRGHVTVDGVAVDKPAATVAADAIIGIDDPAADYVSRSALKLIAALDAFGYSPDGTAALDIGASTGGFTEVLLRRGARRVFGVDVGHGQLHRRLVGDPRVVNLEGINARDLPAARITEPIGAITADVSFISLKLALPPALALALPNAWGVFLVKPQFEVGRDRLGQGGIVRPPDVARAPGANIVGWLAAETDSTVDGAIASPIAGGVGYHLVLVGARRG
jgi:23S rRNA (cytidine1920-2'-O)/16S rRNA (cytidine1409-2'-O)-methyltransferase